MADKRQPWMKWYTRDWRANPKLRMCSFAARGLWADLLSLMYEGAVCGFLLIEGVIPTAKQLTGLLGGTEREIKALLAELGQANVYSVTGQPMPEDVEALVPTDTPDGVILSRRMVRDVAKAARDRANGKGGGNPQLNGPVKGGVNPSANPQRSETRGHKSESQGSNNDTVAPRAPAPGGARTGAVSVNHNDEVLWRARLRGYRAGARWHGDYGPRPESGQCYAPAHILEEWREAQPQTEAA